METTSKGGKVAWIVKLLVCILALVLGLAFAFVAWKLWTANLAVAIAFAVLALLFLWLAWYIWRARKSSWNLRQGLAASGVVLTMLAVVFIVVYLNVRQNGGPKTTAEAPPENAAAGSEAEPEPTAPTNGAASPDESGGGDAASAAASAEPSDYYNVNFSPVGSGNNTRLVDQQPTTADFFISQQSEAGNAVPSGNASVSGQLESEGSQNLTITLSCAFCNGDRLLKGVIAYTPGSRSTDAIFKIVPDRRVRNRSQDNLVFQVTGVDGIVYDNVVVPVSIVAPGPQPQGGLEDHQTAAATVSKPGNLSAPEDARNVDLTITIASKDNRIVMQLDPANPDLAKLFAGKQLQSVDGSTTCTAIGPKCVTREFQTGLTPDSLSQELRSDYVSLDSVVSQDSTLHQALEGSSSALPSLSGNTSLSQAEQDALLQEMHDDGGLLYLNLFNGSQADPDLGKLLKLFDGFNKSGAPMLLRIEEQSVFVPWQFLHPPGPLDWQKFWGFRYEIVVDPEGRTSSGYEPGALDYSGASTVFGKYRAAANEDQFVSTQGDLYAQMLASVGLTNLKTADSKSDFLTDLKRSSDSVGVVAIFTHAVNDLPQSAGAAPFGPEMFFRQGDFVTVRDLQKLTLSLSTTAIFDMHPLVFLNACETGTAGNVATGEWNFPSQFLDMGARGVVATEAPVWPGFAYDFGSAMMKSLGSSKQPVSLVLLNTRNDFLRKNRNPLGLLYSYYGGVDAALILH
jgi:CHAT domain